MNSSFSDYVVYGSGEPVLCIPGMGLNASVFLPLVNEMGARYQFVVVNGLQTLCAERCTVSEMAATATAMLDELQIASAAVVGHSLGGFVAQQMAVDASERVRGVALLASAHKFEYTDFFRKKTRLGQKTAKDVWRDRFERSVCAWFLQHQQAAFESLLQSHNGFVLEGGQMICQMQAAVGFDFTDKAGQVNKDMLIIAGADDVVLPPHAGAAMAALYPHSSLFTMVNCAHLPQFEQPLAVANLLKGWLLQL